MNILFITSTRIGDAVLSTSLLNHLVTVHPQARFTIACGYLSAPLFEDFPNLASLISLRSKKYGRHWLEIWTKTIGTRWDLIIDLRGSAIAYVLWGRQRLVWRSKAVAKHRVEQLADLLATASYAVPTPQTRLWISPERLAHFANGVKGSTPLVAVAPLANWVGKEWPHGRMQQLLQDLHHQEGPLQGCRFLFLAAPNEQDRLKTFTTPFPAAQVMDVSSYSHLLDVAALMGQCDFFVGNDSGLMHMAAALGLPTLGLFGPSKDVFYRPWGPKATYVRAPESPESLLARAKAGENEGLMDGLTLAAVQQKIRQML